MGNKRINITHTNNFDLIRLLAALQVFVGHVFVHLKVEDYDAFLTMSGYFPGVLMFFTISGFLITYSIDRNKDKLKSYFINRFLRIYPALWCCVILTFILFCLQKEGVVNFQDILKWLLAQLSFFQFYTPDAFRTWGVGNPNGSLWTIPVEIQFYVLLPLLFILYSKYRLKFFCMSFLCYRYSLMCFYLIRMIRL